MGRVVSAGLMEFDVGAPHVDDEDVHEGVFQPPTWSVS